MPCGEGQGQEWKTLSFQGTRSKAQQSHIPHLALKGPQTIYDIHKEVKAQRGLRQTRYASVNKRVRFLEQASYIREEGIKKTKAGFQATIYMLTERAYLAVLFDSINLEDLLVRIEDSTASSILAEIMDAVSPIGAL